VDERQLGKSNSYWEITTKQAAIEGIRRNFTNAAKALFLIVGENPINHKPIEQQKVNSIFYSFNISEDIKTMKV
jgi:hypothetical protein